MYGTLADLPSASTYHGLFVHVHTTGGAYYSHGGVWVELANKTDIAELSEDTTPALGGNLDAGGFNITNAGTIISTGVTGPLVGNVTGLVHGIDVRTIGVEDNLDLGNIVTNINSGIQFFLSTNGIDHGTITAAASINSDFGTFA